MLFVAWGLGYPLPLVECLALIALSAMRQSGADRCASAAGEPAVRAMSATIQLGYDLLQLGGLLALTGGLQNPFSLLLLAPVSVSATTLPQRSTLVLAALAIAHRLADRGVAPAAALGSDGTGSSSTGSMSSASGSSLLCGVVFIAAYTNRVAHEARQLADALTATELALSRHEQLSALDGLAAAAAHELGTPLSTIALAAKEMRADIPPGPLADDVELIIAQSARCRAILAKLRNLRSGESGDPFAAVPMGELLRRSRQAVRGSSGKSHRSRRQ